MTGTASCPSEPQQKIFDRRIQLWLSIRTTPRIANGKKFASSALIRPPLYKATFIDYKDTAKLRRYMSERSKILPRRTTGVCAMHQRELTEAIKRARQIALLPYVTD